MRTLIALAAALLMLAPAAAGQRQARPLTSLQAAIDWVNDYRVTRDLHHAPLAIRALSQYGAFKEPEAAAVYVGFVAGLIGSNPDQADRLLAGMLPVRRGDEWVIVRGIAYSGAPRWRDLLRRFAGRMPARQVMIEQYLDGKLARLDQLVIRPSPTTLERVRDALAIHDVNEAKKVVLEPTQTVVDVLWGYYLGSGSYGPVLRMVELLPWSKDRDDTDRLTVGSMAKYTLAMNASRDAALLDKLKSIRAAKSQPPDTTKILDEIIQAAETADASRMRKDALAALEQLKIKGPAYKRELSTWGKVGQGAVAVGCVVAAATGHVELGLPCVIGGGATSAALYYMNDR